MTDAMVPARYRVTARRTETADTVTVALRPVDKSIAFCLPGQFTMLYVFGVGEVPVSVSGIGNRGLTQTVRAVGAVTNALCAVEIGQMVGVRGPYGTNWPVADAEGRDLVVVAGGIGLAPLRPVVRAALAARRHYGRAVLLVGARSPDNLIFARELDDWRRQGVDVETTIDHPVGAICPAFGRGCYGCFGPMASPGTGSLAARLRGPGMAAVDVKRVFATFNAAAPAFAAAARQAGRDGERGDAQPDRAGAETA